MADQKLRRLKRSGLFGNDTKGATIKRACSADELRKAYRLVHDVFMETGFLRPEPSGMRLRIFETSSETATFIAEKNGEVVGVLSVVGDSGDLGLPSDGAFGPELATLRATGVRLCELTNQAVAVGYRKTAISTELMRCAVAHGMQAGYHEAIATVSPSHRGFYKLIGFDQLGSERSYSTKLYDPVIALRIDFNVCRQPPNEMSEAACFLHHFAMEGNQFMALVNGWAKSARRQFLNADLLEQLFVQDRNFISECTAEELAILRRRWGQEIFQMVTWSLDFAAQEQRDFTPMVVETRAMEAAEFPQEAEPAGWQARENSSPWGYMVRLRRQLIGLAAATSISLWTCSSSHSTDSEARSVWGEQWDASPNVVAN